MSAAQLIAGNLANLPHPDGTPRTLAGFNTALMPENLREQINKTAQDIGDAIIYLLESNGYRILTDAEITAAAHAEQPPAPIGNVHCTNCDARLFSLNLTNPEHIRTNGQWLLEAMARLKPGCPHT